MILYTTIYEDTTIGHVNSTSDETVWNEPDLCPCFQFIDICFAIVCESYSESLSVEAHLGTKHSGAIGKPVRQVEVKNPLHSRVIHN